MASDIDWWNNACLNWAGKSWTLYATGYLEAARILVRYVEENRCQQDALVYPIVFLYRQYLELTLKNLVTTISNLLDDPVPVGYKHSLVDQWKQLPPLTARLEEAMGQQVLASPEQRDEIRERIAEFETLDRTSLAFRYPEDKVGENPLPPDLTHINLRRFREGMDRLAYLLDQLTVSADYFSEYFAGYEEP